MNGLSGIRTGAVSALLALSSVPARAFFFYLFLTHFEGFLDLVMMRNRFAHKGSICYKKDTRNMMDKP